MLCITIYDIIKIGFSAQSVLLKFTYFGLHSKHFVVNTSSDALLALKEKLPSGERKILKV